VPSCLKDLLSILKEAICQAIKNSLYSLKSPTIYFTPFEALLDLSSGVCDIPRSGFRSGQLKKH
jgi:hypothetical protein